jgi:hypothetical protein
MRRDHESAGAGRAWTSHWATGYGQPRWYRASRRASLLRLAIPTILAVATASVAIIAAASYLDSNHTTLQRTRAGLTPSPTHPPVISRQVLVVDQKDEAERVR